MRNRIKNIITSIFLGALLLSICPYLFNEPTLYTFPLYWILGLLFSIALSFLLNLRKPRKKFYYCYNVIKSAIVLTIATWFFLVVSIGIAFMDNFIVQTLILVALTILYVFLWRKLIYRGICIYDNGTIKVYKGKIKTYNTNTIDDIRFEYTKNKCKLTIIINGCEEIFSLSKISAIFAQKNLRELIPSNP